MKLLLYSISRNLYRHWEVKFDGYEIQVHEGDTGTIGFKYKLQPQKSDPESMIAQKLKEGYREKSVKSPPLAVEDYMRINPVSLEEKQRAMQASHSWPAFIDEMESTRADSTLPNFLKEVYKNPELSKEVIICFPLHLVNSFARFAFADYPDCLNIPEHDRYALEAAARYDDDISDLPGYYCCDFDVEDAGKKVFSLRMIYNAGYGDCNDGFWGAVWDKKTKALVAYIMSTGNCETTIAVITEYRQQFRPYAAWVPANSDMDRKHSIGNVIYKNDHQLEKFICLAILIHYRGQR